MIIKKITMIEIIVTLMLFSLIIGTLRFMTVDLLDYSGNIENNLSNINIMNNALTGLDRDLKNAHKVVIERELLVLTSVNGETTYNVLGSELHKDGKKWVDLRDVEMWFEDGTNEANGGNGNKVVKVNFSYKHKLRKTSEIFQISKFIGTLE